MKILESLMRKYLLRKNFKPYMANHFSGLLVSDFKNCKLPLKDKLWAYKNGFLSHRIIDYKLTRENYREYLSDYDYYKMYPLNGPEHIWIDDKMTTKYVYSKFDEFLPKYYFMLFSDKVIKLMNADSDVKADIEGVVTTLKRYGMLAFKKTVAFGGDGFYRAEFDGNSFLVNGELYDENGIHKFLEGLNNYLVMEYIVAHEDIRKYYSNAAGVLRVMVINDGEPIIANAHIRLGSSRSKYIDAYSGSVISMVDVATGKYSGAYIQDGFNFVKSKIHPDSKIEMSGTIPRWEFIKEKLIEISNYTPQISYFGYDVCVTDTGFKIFEINSHQGMSLFQLEFPLLKDNPAAEYFKKHISK